MPAKAVGDDLDEPRLDTHKWRRRPKGSLDETKCYWLGYCNRPPEDHPLGVAG